MIMKRCRICAQEKPLAEFHPATQCRDGRRGECIACFNGLARQHRAKPEAMDRAKKYRARQDVKDRQNAARRSEQGRERYLKKAKASPSSVLSFALYRALKRRPTADPVTHAQLMGMYKQQGGFCALSGLRMTWLGGKIALTSISIDRIDSKRGYSADNVRLICHAVNRLRGNHTDAEMLVMARAIVAKADAEWEKNSVVRYTERRAYIPGLMMN